MGGPIKQHIFKQGLLSDQGLIEQTYLAALKFGASSYLKPVSITVYLCDPDIPLAGHVSRLKVWYI